VSSLDADLSVACLLILAVLVPGQGQRSHTSDEPGAENVGRVSAVR
jgi:hypothetical protein